MPWLTQLLLGAAPWAAFITALAALLVAIFGKRSTTKTFTEDHGTQEVVDGNVLAQFLGLTERVTSLELDLVATKLDLLATKNELQAALKRLDEMQKLEEWLRASLHEKDKLLAVMAEDNKKKGAQVERLRKRILHLEEVCKAAGINGESVTDRRAT